jgi:hypothetical protein
MANAMCGSFKREILAGVHRWVQSTTDTGSGDSTASAHTFKVAMFTSSASLDQDTTNYSTSNEVSGGGGVYSAGGAALGSVTLGLADNSSGTATAFLDFADSTWSSSTISNARYALIYNSTLDADTSGTTSTTHIYIDAYPAVAVLDFGSNKSSSAGDFTIQYPTNDANSAIIRLA